MHLVAIGIAAIVIVGGLCLVFLGNDDNNSNPPDELNITSKFPVYGNANNDLKMDADDKTLIQSIIDGNASFSDYPLADANCDGVVNVEDIAVVDKLINKEACKVTAIGLNIDGKQTKVTFDFPVTNTTSFGTNMALTIVNAGASDSVVGVLDGLSYTKAAQKSIHDNPYLVDLDLSRSNVDRSVLMNGISSIDIKLAESQEKIGALFLDHSARGLDEHLDYVFQEIPVLRLAVADPIEEIYASRLIGFLTGNDDVAYTYASKSIQVIEYVQNAVKDIPEDQRNSYICMTMGIYICENDSEYNGIGSYVGAIPYYKINEEFKNTYVGNGSSKMQSKEALSNYSDIDFMINNRSIDYLTTPKGGNNGAQTALLESWDKSLKSGGKYSDYYKDLDNYEGLVYLNNLLPGAIKIAFAAAIVSPDYVTMEYAIDTLEEFEQICVSLDGVTIDNSLIVGTYDDYVAAGGTSL